MIDTVDALSARFRVPLSILSVLMFIVSCAGHAGFMPKLEVVSGWTAIIIAVIWNMVWWGISLPAGRAAAAAAQ